MISMMELMEEKTPLTKNTSKKKGMTLVEVMAAMAILSILFVAISSLMINVVKSEIRADEKLEINNYIKSALTLFDVKSVDIDNYTSMRTI
ncbi:type II secretion system protein, partial [Clostridium saudiense]|nr:type II secretion system protein [Clostridium saudiense]